MFKKEKDENKKQEQKDELVNLWMTDLNETPEEKALRQKQEKEKEEKRTQES